MKNVDIARDSFDPLKNFSRVLKQQGRVELEADWNEQAAMTLRCMRLMMSDLVGPYGGPEMDCGFRVFVHNDVASPKLDSHTKQLLKDCSAGDFVLSSGHYYVEGVLCENHAPFRYTHQSGGRHRPLAVETKQCHLVYLDVWEREVTALEDESLREVALGGADTAARMQVAWVVRCVPVDRSDDKGSPKNTNPSDLSPNWLDHVSSFQPLHRGAMSARTRQTGLDSNPDLPGTEGSYRGIENQLYRLEIHRGGKCSDKHGPTFKWSRDNGTVAFAVERVTHDDDKHVHVTLASTGRDDTSTLAIGDAVEFGESAGRGRGLTGVLFEVVAIDIPNRLVTVLRSVPLDGKAAPEALSGDWDHPLVLRRWDHVPSRQKKGGLAISEGAVLIEEGRWLPIEDGIEVKFETSVPNAVNHYRAGDYWLVVARVATGDVDWPRSDGHAQPLAPHGVQHYYAPLALVDVTETETLRLAPLTRRFGYHRLKELARDVFAREGD